MSKTSFLKDKDGNRIFPKTYSSLVYDESTGESVQDSLVNKVEKVEGKQLSSNDFTNEEKSKLSSLENYDDTDVKESINEINEDINGINDVIEEVKTDAAQNVKDINSEIGTINTALQNDYASAIKPTVSGASINVTDSADAPIQDLKVTPTDTSVTSVDITVCGKNVFSNTFLTSYEKFNVIIDSGNVTVTTTDATWYKGFTQIKKLNPNTTYTFSAVGVSMQNGGAFRVGIVDNGTNKYAKSTTVGERISYSFTTDASGDVTLMMGGNWDNSSSTTVYTNVQLEVGNLTAYEPYKEQTATIDTATQTGWENLKTYYPTTNIINTDSANMDCTYVADTKNYIDNKLLELTANMVDLATMQMLDN